jgi:hypothetical protein
MRTVVKILSFAAMVILLPQNTARAEDAGQFSTLVQLTDWLKDHLSISSGSDATNSSVSVSSTVTIGINKLNEEGWRLLLHTDTSAFRYTAVKNYPLNNGGKQGRYQQFAVDFAGLAYGADVMPGYQFQYGRQWLRLCAGATYQAASASRTALFRMDGQEFSAADYAIPPGDPNFSGAGAHWGAKAAGDFWAPLGDRAWTSAGASLSSINANYTISGRLGYNLPQWLSSTATLGFGPEVSAYGDANYAAQRAGAFARVGLWDHEVTLSGGLGAGDHTAAGPYATVGMYRRF